jgi:hypothetical protein
LALLERGTRKREREREREEEAKGGEESEGDRRQRTGQSGIHAGVDGWMCACMDG